MQDARTFAELNNAFFIIERRCSESTDDFEEIGRVLGAGTSQTQSDYRFVDHTQNCEGVNYYRLSQTDFDGTREDITVRAVSCNSNESEPQVSVEQGRMTVRYAEEFEAYLYTIDGKRLALEQSTNGECMIYLPSESSGIYTLVVVSDRVFKKAISVIR